MLHWASFHFNSCFVQAVLSRVIWRSEIAEHVSFLFYFCSNRYVSLILCHIYHINAQHWVICFNSSSLGLSQVARKIVKECWLGSLQIQSEMIFRLLAGLFSVFVDFLKQWYSTVFFPLNTLDRSSLSSVTVAYVVSRAFRSKWVF